MVIIFLDPWQHMMISEFKNYNTDSLRSQNKAEYYAKEQR